MKKDRCTYKSIFFKGINLLLILGVLGCAATATKHELHSVTDLPPIENKKSITFRYYFKTKLNGDRGYRFYWDESLSKQMLNLLVLSGQFSEVIEYRQSSADNRERNFNEKEIQAVKNDFPIKTELFLDIQAETKDYGPHAYMYWGIFHILSLGLIPIYINADINWNTILYNRDGLELASGSFKDKSSIWVWSPLFFFNGFHMFRDVNEVAEPIKNNAVMHILNQSRSHLLDKK